MMVDHGDYFDDEELINDYMEEEFDEPPPYNDDGEEEMIMAEIEKRQNKQHREGGPNDNYGDDERVTPGAADDVALNVSMDSKDGDGRWAASQDFGEDENKEGEEEYDDGPPRIIETSVAESRKNVESLLYGFERFSGVHDWRTVNLPSTTTNTMEATQWKRRIEANPDSADGNSGDSTRPGRIVSKGVRGKNTSKATAPDAQLVEFVNQSCGENCVSITKRRRFKGGSNMPVAENGSVAITLSDGSRVYVRKNDSPGSLSVGDTIENAHAGIKSLADSALLGVPMSELLRRADIIQRKAERRKRAQQQKIVGGTVHDSMEAKAEDAENHDKTSAVRDNNDGAPQKDGVGKPKKNPESVWHQKCRQLWVDKHAPTLFSHLLSDERTNREVLRALRAWDPYVFQKKPPPRPTFMQKLVQSSARSNTNGKGKAPNEIGDDPQTHSDDTRPDEHNRVILLSGPPGVGKTTLALIVARHAGYRPLEVNASDERSASVLTERVIRAMESSTLNISTTKKGFENDNDMMGRPNCLILDEIDGADAKAAISALVEIIRADIPPKGTKAKNKKHYLRRPIIFICNHKYAPALRPLLPYARQFDVAPPLSNRLVARLRSILNAENIDVASGNSVLRQLVTSSGGDIRSCLYTLQFAAARARELAWRKRIKEEELGIVKRGGGGVDVDISQTLSMTLGGKGQGMKDERSDVFEVLTTIFRKLKKLSKENRATFFHKSIGQDKFGTKDVDRVLQSVECFGDNSRALDCLFMNILRVSYIDPTLDRCSAAHEWLSSADIYRSFKTSVASNNHAEHHAMQKFHIPSAAAAVHLLCRIETRADLTYSIRPMIDAQYQLEANCGLVSKFVEGLSPKTRCSISSIISVTDVVPYSLWLLSAGEGNCSLNRAVSSKDILSNAEKAAFDAHIGTLRALGLTYVKLDENTHSINGRSFVNSAMRLEPEIDQIVRFEDLNVPESSKRKDVPVVLKELLAHMANVEKMKEREEEAKHSRREGEKQQKENQSTSTKENENKNRRNSSESKKNSEKASKTELDVKPQDGPPSKRAKTTTAKNFLGLGAAKAKAAKTARKAALVGFDRSNKVKLSHSGSGLELKHVVKFKYQKGFTQAVRVPCRVEDLM